MREHITENKQNKKHILCKQGYEKGKEQKKNINRKKKSKEKSKNKTKSTK